MVENHKPVTLLKCSKAVLDSPVLRIKKLGGDVGSRFSTRPSHGYRPAEVPPFAEVVGIRTTVVNHIPGPFVVISRDVVSSDIVP